MAERPCDDGAWLCPAYLELVAGRRHQCAGMVERLLKRHDGREWGEYGALDACDAMETGY